MIDNYDSFTYNIVQYLGKLGADVEVYRNDKITIDQIEQRKPDAVVISPGPCTPKEAGISVDVVKRFAGKLPIFGVCLGHQCIGYAFGARIVRARKIMHGKASKILHNERELFEGVENPFSAIRYHSLVIERQSLPECLKVTAESEDDKEIMAVKHRSYPVYGVQFHPESILTEHGLTILGNFLSRI